MLGEMVSEERGQLTGMRVLPSEAGLPKVEVSYQAAGTLLGIHVTDMGTYISTARPDGTLFGQGQGIATTADGEAVTWKGQGIGHFTGRGSGVSWRGSLYFQTSSERLSRLNGLVAVFEDEVDEGDKMEVKTWEWK
jgi:hypothetical protein